MQRVIYYCKYIKVARLYMLIHNYIIDTYHLLVCSGYTFTAAKKYPEINVVSCSALRIVPSTFGIFDTFHHEEGREAHLQGKIAAALMTHADELLSSPPVIEKVELLAVKEK